MSATNAELEMQGKGVIDRDDGYCGADECADGGADIDIDGDVGVCTGVDVGTGVGVGTGVCVNLDAGVGVGVGTGVRVNVDTGVGVGVSVGTGTGVNVDVSVAVGVNIGDGGGDSCCSGCDRDGKTLVLPLPSAPSTRYLPARNIGKLLEKECWWIVFLPCAYICLSLSLFFFEKKLFDFL